MPPVLPPSNARFAKKIADTINQSRWGATLGGGVIPNAKGQPVVALGVQPVQSGGTAQYGIGLYNKALNSLLALFGEDDNGNVALKFLNSSGQVQVQVDVNGLHIYNGSGDQVVLLDGEGLHAYDSGGTEQVRAGELNTSPAQYGLAVRPYNGTELQMVGGALNTTANDATNVTNTSFAAFGGSSSVTCEIGPSGSALVSVQCRIATGASGQEGFVGAQADGGSWFDFLTLSASQGPGGVQATFGTAFLWGGLTPGLHTFTIGYSTGNNGTSTVSFTTPTLTVQPL